MKKKTSLLIILVIVFSLSGCGWWKDYFSRNKRLGNTPEIQYQAGIAAYQDGRYKRAIEHFTRVKEQFPLHPLALMAELGIGDSHFSDGQYGEAELAYTDFLNLHPTNENIPYVMYQIGICHFNQTSSVDRDPSETIRTAKDFERLIARFPASKFAFMAEKKILECRQKLAEHEFLIAEFYFKRGKYKAALGRFEYLAKNYPSLGYDYQSIQYIAETKKRLAEEEAKKAKGLLKQRIADPQNRATGSWD